MTEDLSGPLLAHLAEDAGAEIVAMEVVPDDFALIEDRLHHYVDDNFTFVFTTGGTGLISGRKAFQRPMDEGVALLHAIQDVYLNDDVSIA